MKNVAIYLTNTDRSAFAARHSSDALKVIARLEGVGARYNFTIFDVTEGEFPTDPNAYDAVIITGSPAYVDDGDEWIGHLTKDIVAITNAKTPLIGLCFGHQAIMAALGGKVARKDFWIFGAEEFALHNSRPWMQPAAQTLKLYAANKAQVAELPDGFDLLGGSQACPIAVTALGNHVFTTQFHPEMDDGFIAALIEEYAEYLGPEVADAAFGSIEVPADGPIFGQWMRDFIDLPRG
jgi:GMP synthase-like glutamine amidotransferase